MAGLKVGVDKIAHQPMAVAVEIDPHQFTGAIENRAARIAANGVGSGGEVEGGLQIQVRFPIDPALGQFEGGVFS